LKTFAFVITNKIFFLRCRSWAVITKVSGHCKTTWSFLPTQKIHYFQV